MSWIQDAGHGGTDPGAVANGQQEKEWTLEAAIYVNRRLKELGIKSDTTRNKDTTLLQTKRTGDVKKYPKCISHHYNAGGGVGAEFIHSIYTDGKFELILEDEFKKEGYPVRRSFSRKYGNNDYYYMHRETGTTRTTIVEYDFLDGNNFSKLKKKEYREGMYECVVKAICRDEGIKYVPPKKGGTKMADNKPSDWARTSWEKAKKKQDKNGVAIFDGNNPKGEISREQVAVVLDRLGLLD